MRKTGPRSAPTREAIRAASLALIFKKSFAAMSLRDLAREVGIQPGSIYNYIKTKEDLLNFLIRDALERRLERIEQAVTASPDPVAGLRAFVGLTFDFHTREAREMVVGDGEMRSLTPAHRRAVVRLRDRYDRHLTDIIEKGREAGLFTVADARIATFAIISMISGVSRWYVEGGRLPYEALLDQYLGFAFAIVGHVPDRPPPVAVARTRIPVGVAGE